LDDRIGKGKNGARSSGTNYYFALISKMAAALNKRFPHLILLRDRQQRIRKQEKFKKSIWTRKSFQERQWKSEYNLLIEE
jgi:hypothetical protein